MSPLWSRRLPPAAGHEDDTLPEVQFHGLDVGSVGPSGLYEVTTTAGVWVRLHDMSFLGLAYFCEPPVLTMAFRYEDPEWTPDSAVETPLAVFTFEGVHVHSWTDEEPTPDTPPGVLGQVSLFDYFRPTGTFHLSTYVVDFVFTATSVDLRLDRRDAVWAS